MLLLLASRLIEFVLDLISWPWRFEYADANHSPKCGIGAIINLLQILVAVVLGLLAYIQVENRSEILESKYRVVAIYVAVSLLPSLVLLRMLRLEQHLPYGNSSRRHAFDVSTVKMIKLSLLLSALLVFGTAYAFTNDLLPGQSRKVELAVSSELEEFKWTKVQRGGFDIAEGTQGVWISVTISRKQFQKINQPNPLTIIVELDSDVSGSWGIANGYGYFVRAEGDEREDEDSKPGMSRTDKQAKREFLWHHIRVGADHVLKLKLYKKRNAKMGLEQLKAKLVERPASVVTANAYGPQTPASPSRD